MYTMREKKKTHLPSIIPYHHTTHSTVAGKYVGQSDRTAKKREGKKINKRK